MKISLKNIVGTAKKEVLSHPLLYSFLFIVFCLSIFLRVYRLDQMLGFYYDQGRDALVIWDFIHNGNLFLIGPTTGIEGIYRGPFYYWLISPFYYFGQGNPVWPATFLALTTCVAIILIYCLAAKIHSRTAGVIAVIFSSFSFYFILAARWLSNPTPMMIISMLLVLGVYLIFNNKKWAWILLGGVLGQAMQFGSAAEVFYFPVVALLYFLYPNLRPNKKVLTFSFVFLLLSFTPQIVFDLTHDGVLSKSIQKFLFEEQSFKLGLWDVVKIRIPFYFSLFFEKLFPVTPSWRFVSLLFLSISLLITLPKLIKNKSILWTFFLLLSPLIGMLFFQGNKGNVYGYYFTGYYFIFVLCVSFILGEVWKRGFAKVLVILIIILFVKDNFEVTKNYINGGLEGPQTIMFGNQIKSVDWILNDSKGQKFNVDVYVPPVIPYAYDYLLLWKTKSKCPDTNCNLELDETVPLLYTLYEVDPPHPERLDAWLNRQYGIGSIVTSENFGGITVQRRNRIK